MKPNNPKVEEVDFSDVDKNTVPGNNLNAYKARVRYSAQQHSLEGISFELELTYSGEEASSIHNPLYYIQYLIKLNGEYLRTNRKAPIPLINRKEPIQFNDDFNFKISGIYLNGKQLDLDTAVNSSIIDFSNNDKILFDLRISEYVNLENGQLMSLQSGIYELEILFSIIGSSHEIDDVQTRTLKAQHISIKLE